MGVKRGLRIVVNMLAFGWINSFVISIEQCVVSSTYRIRKHRHCNLTVVFVAASLSLMLLDFSHVLLWELRDGEAALEPSTCAPDLPFRD